METFELSRLKAFAEQAVGGVVAAIERQDRWRPAWFVQVERDDGSVPVYLRGARPANAAVFPEHRREADVMRVLARHGVAVPQIYGYCEEPACIVMAAIPGTRDMAAAQGREAQSTIINELADTLAAMHRIPPEEFVVAGVEMPKDKADQCLAGVRAYMPHFRRTKRAPEPLLEFAIRWMERHLPAEQRPPALVQYDCGQFHHDGSHLVGLYDFEFSLIGDPMMDLATIAMREVVEPYGVTLPELGRMYERASGAPLDHEAILFYTLQFGTVGAMQFADAVRYPQPGDPHAIYLQWDRGLRRNIVECLCRLSGTPFTEPPCPPDRSDDAVLMTKLADAVAQIPADEGPASSARQMALDLVEVTERVLAAGQQMRLADLEEISTLMGVPCTNLSGAERELEAFVLAAGPEHDDDLIALFSGMESRQESLLAGTRIGLLGRESHLRSYRDDNSEIKGMGAQC